MMRHRMRIAALVFAVATACEHRAAPKRRRGVASDWCRRHGLPESQCTRCNPQLIPRYKTSGDWCASHGFPESVCPICHPMRPPPGVAAPKDAVAIDDKTRVRLASPAVAAAAGLRVVAAKRASLTIGIDCTARIAFDQNRVADVRAPLPGIVRGVKVDLGQQVKARAPLFVLESARVGDLQGRLPAARQRVAVATSNLARKRKLAQQRIATPREVEVAERELAAAKAQLRSVSAGLRVAGARGGHAIGRYTIRAPIAGSVVRRPAILGTFATARTSLAMIADTRKLWAMLEVRETDAAMVRVGQRAHLRVDGLPPGTHLTGRVTWIAAEVNAHTHTVDARAVVDNAKGMLRAGLFAHATIHVASQRDAVAVPRSAVQRIAGARYVFLEERPGLYRPVKVELGRSGHGLVEVRGGLRIGSRVVTDGAFLLRTELSKHKIGTGCCEVGPGKER
ncbi:MAG: efflux transporter periplasmic adaptor subunit [Proteobacteria bacterium]|nr:MAG: efflux transporter periplasmic adaptor subunit [Pseudomonadota bacterium]